MLNAMFDERMDYVVNQGGPPHSLEVHEAFCNHCPPKADLTAAEEVEISRATRDKAEGGEQKAQYMLGVRYLQGKGLPLDPAEGVKWLQKAVANGSADAAYTLANMYDRGFYVSNDKTKAAQLYELGLNASGAKIVVTVRLGQMYEFGLGVPVNYEHAMELYQIAAKPEPIFHNRSENAEFMIGRLYAQGKGVPKDYTKAMQWFLKAAGQGLGYGGLVPEAECALAIQYAKGLGVLRDDLKRDFWLSRPNVMGLKTCRELRYQSRKD